jgi:hypothetical protein
MAASISRLILRMGGGDSSSSSSSSSGGGGVEGAPYQVIARFHRGYVIANRSAHKVRGLGFKY